MAKKKISAFTETTTLADADIIPVVINPGTSPASRKITKSNYRKSILAAITDPVIVKSGDGINFDTADGSDTDIDILTLDVTGTPKLWWDESIDAFSLTKRLFLGGTQTTASVDPMVNVNRAVNDDVAGNGHCFSDSSVITRAGGVAYNSFDARITISGTANYDHYAGFQSLPILDTTGTTTNYYGFIAGLSVTDGVCTNAYGLYVQLLAETAPGTITNAYGVYIAQQLRGDTLNYSLYCAGQTSLSYFEGKVGILQAPQSHIGLAVGTLQIAPVATMFGIQVATENTKATYDYLAGIDLQPRSIGTANHLGLIGVFSRPQHESTGTLANEYDFYAGALGGAGSGAVTNRYGLKVINVVGGTLTNQYGVYIDLLNKGAALNYALYTAGATPSLFEGPQFHKNCTSAASKADHAQILAADKPAGNSCIVVKTENNSLIWLYQQAHIADAAGGTEVATINAILAALENIGFLATS